MRGVFPLQDITQAMGRISYCFAKNLFSLLYKGTNSTLTLSNVERVPKRGVMFVANHFTNTETVLLPYILDQKGIKTRSLAKSSIFTPASTQLLNGLGVFSTKGPGRDEMIVDDLVYGTHNWFIYPEGMMVKNKRVVDDENRLHLDTPDMQGPPKTGATAFAMEAFIKLHFLKKQDPKAYAHLADDIYLQPITITYYPLRSKETLISDILTGFVESEKEKEEIMAETSYLIDGHINIYFHPPYSLKEVFKPGIKALSPFVNQSTLRTIAMATLRKPLTYRIMMGIYEKIFVNIDHLVVFYLKNVNESEIHTHNLRDFLILASLIVRYITKDNYHQSIADEIFSLYTHRPYKPFEEIVQYAKDHRLLIEGKGKLWVNQDFFQNNHLFDRIRLDNPFEVILNEFQPLRKLRATLMTLVYNRNPSNLILKTVFDTQMIAFKEDYQRYYHEGVSKDKSVGAPRWRERKSKKIALVLCHGYMAAPKEMDFIAEKLQDQYSIYQMRLTGHGTHHSNLDVTSHRDWVRDFLKAVVALRSQYERVIAVGFSTGASIALYVSTITDRLLDGVVALSPAIEPTDRRVFFAGGLNWWNNFAKKLSLESITYKNLENVPDYPDTNYAYNSIPGVVELGKMLRKTKDNLHLVTLPTLIMQCRNDQVISPKSSQMIYERIQSKQKELYFLEGDEHIIVRGQHLQSVCDRVLPFIKNHFQDWAS